MPVLSTLNGGYLESHVKRAFTGTTGSGTSTITLLTSQWTNPNDVLSILLIIGGDIVQKALAQTSGGYFTPVCFSFGWVAYSFTALVGIIGDGRLLPVPDYPVKVYNLKTGYVRENKNWIVGRLLRDNEIHASKTHPLHGGALRITIYEAAECRDSPAVAGSGRVQYFGLFIISIQIVVAAIPFILYGEWGVFLITLSGTCLAQAAGNLPQWRAEKLPNKRKSFKSFALTSGNGARDVMIILGGGNSLDLEELSASETPRSTRFWDSLPYFSRVLREKGEVRHHSNGSVARRAIVFRGIPLGFWVTIYYCTLQSMLWLAFLITVAGLNSHTWYLLLVGGIGMFQNAMVAAISRDPRKRNLPLIYLDTIISRTVMDGLMDLEVTHTNAGRYLRHEFFPGELRKNELEWWNGAWKEGTAEYDRKRMEESARREKPRSMLPKYHNTARTEDDKMKENSNFGATQPPARLSPELDLRASQLHEISVPTNTRNPQPRILPIPDPSFDREFIGPQTAIPRVVQISTVPLTGRVQEIRMGNSQKTVVNDPVIHLPDRKDTSSSGSLSFEDYQLPDWVD